MNERRRRKGAGIVREKDEEIMSVCSIYTSF